MIAARVNAPLQDTNWMVIGGNRGFDDCLGAGLETSARGHTPSGGCRRQEVLSCQFAEQARGAADAEMGQTWTNMRENTDQLRERNAKEREKAAGALLELLHEEDIEGFNAAGGFVSLVEVARSGNGALKAEAAMALSNLALNSENKEKIAEAGGIPPLIALVRDGNEVQKEKAVTALLGLSVNTDNQEKISEAGGIPPLITLVRDGNEVQKDNAAGALLNLSVNRVARERIGVAGGIPPLIALVQDGNDVQKEYAAGTLWNLASENSRCQNAIISEAGAVDIIIRLTLNGTPTQQENASGVLVFLAQHLDADTKLTVATKGGVEALLRWIMRPENSKWVHEGLVALLGLCVDGDDIVRSSVEKVGGCEILAKLIQSDDERIKSLAGKMSAWLSVICARLQTFARR